MRDRTPYGERVRAKRQRLELSLRQCAQAIGVSHVYLGDIEKGRRLPSLAVAAAIGNALGRNLLLAWYDEHIRFAELHLAGLRAARAALAKEDPDG